MKRTYLEHFNPIPAQAEARKKKKHTVNPIFPDTNYVRCPSCGNQCSKPPMSLIATDWYMHDRGMHVPPQPTYEPSITSNLYHHLISGVSKDHIVHEWMNVFNARHVRRFQSFGTIVSCVPPAHKVSSYDASRDLYTIVDEEFEPTPVMQKIIEQVDKGIQLDSNSSIVRLGNIVSNIHANIFDYEMNAVKPIFPEYDPMDMVLNLVREDVCAESSAWFKGNFFDRVFNDYVSELNMFPDYTMKGMVDVYTKEKVKTQVMTLGGIIIDKYLQITGALPNINFWDKEVSDRVFKLRELKRLAVMAGCESNQPFIDDSFNTLLTEECAIFLHCLEDELKKDGETMDVLLNTFNIHHNMKKWIVLEGSYYHSYDTGFSKIVRLPVDLNATGTMITFYDWTSRSRAYNHDSATLLLKFFMPHYSATWGTHRVYCYDCYKQYGSDVVSAQHAPNYNFFYELYRALAMKLEKRLNDLAYSDITIVTQ